MKVITLDNILPKNNSWVATRLIIPVDIRRKVMVTVPLSLYGIKSMIKNWRFI